MVFMWIPFCLVGAISPRGGAGDERDETLRSPGERRQGMSEKKCKRAATFARSLIAIANNDQIRQQIVSINVDNDGRVRQRLRRRRGARVETFAEEEGGSGKRFFLARRAAGLPVRRAPVGSRQHATRPRKHRPIKGAVTH